MEQAIAYSDVQILIKKLHKTQGIFSTLSERSNRRDWKQEATRAKKLKSVVFIGQPSTIKTLGESIRIIRKKSIEDIRDSCHFPFRTLRRLLLERILRIFFKLETKMNEKNPNAITRWSNKCGLRFYRRCA